MRKLFLITVLIINSTACKHKISKPYPELTKQDSNELTVEQSKTNKTDFPLTNQEKKNYVLSIDQNAIGWKDTTIVGQKKKYRILKVPIRLLNHSDDTLKYVDFNCSWNEVFISNNKDLSNFPKSCLANIPDVFIVLPQRSVVFNLPVMVNKVIIGTQDSFKIGMYLCKYKSAKDWGVFLDLCEKNALPYGWLIWSNEVEIPQK